MEGQSEFSRNFNLRKLRTRTRARVDASFTFDLQLFASPEVKEPIPAEELIRRVKEETWTDEFFLEIQDDYLRNLNAVRQALAETGDWNRFDTAFSEFMRPGQAACITRPGEEETAPRSPEQPHATAKGGKFVSGKPTDFTLHSAADVVVAEPEWLVPGYVPRNGITALAGEGGVGKTSTWCSLVASLTTGKQSFLLGGQIPFDNEPLTALVLSAEDSWSHVLRPRLEACGADLTRVRFIPPEDDRFVDLNFNSELLEGIIEANRPDVVVFDPIQSFVPANLRMGDRNAMRKCFSPLIGYGEKYGLTSLIIVHANKQSGVWGRKRIADSSDIWDASRSVLMIGETAEAGVRYISQEKSNYGKLNDTVLFTLENSVPVFKCFSTKRDRDFIQAETYERKILPIAEEAKEFILDTLKEHGEPMEVCELDGLAKANGFTNNALREGKAAARSAKLVKQWSTGYGKDKKFFIALRELKGGSDEGTE